MGPKDLLKPGTIALGVVAAGAIGFAAGFLVARDPQRLRQLARAVAGGVERVAVALAESREELADLWAEAREDARHDIETQAFTAAAAATASAAAVDATSIKDEPQEPVADKGNKTAKNAAP